MPDYLAGPLLALFACFVVPVIVLGILSIYILVRGQRYLRPNEARLRQEFIRLKEQHAGSSTAQLAQKIIHQQAVRSGIIGAVTSVGGFPLLPLGLSIDLYTSAKLQTDMLHFIAWAYSQDAAAQRRPSLADVGVNLPEVPVLKLNEVLSSHIGRTGEEILIRGGGELSRFALRRLLLIISEKALAKVIPGVGLLIGFIVNYLSTRGIGTIAAQWYAGNLDRLGTALRR